MTLKDEAYTAKMENGLYTLLSKTASGIINQFLFEGCNYLLKKELISQGGLKSRTLDIQYPAHSEYPKAYCLRR